MASFTTLNYHCFPAVYTLPRDVEEEDIVMYSLVVLIRAEAGGGESSLILLDRALLTAHLVVILLVLAEEYIEVEFARRVGYEWTLYDMPVSRSCLELRHALTSVDTIDLMADRSRSQQQRVLLA